MRLQTRIDELERFNGRKSLPEANDQDQPSPSPSPSVSDQNPLSSANAMMGLIEEGDHREESLVGDSSAASFMNRMKAVLDQHVSPGSAQQTHSTTPSAGTAGALRQRRFKTPHYVLPSRQEADKLLEVYWRLVDALYPFVHKDDFMLKYQSLWTGSPTMDDEICFICLLNAIFAVACILDSSIRPQDRVSSGEVYFKRAQGFVDLDFLQFQSVHTVQCLLLLAQYLQSTREPQQCWLFVGLAIRIAQSLGLDLPSTSAGTPADGPDDTLRKVWHGCVLMDRTLSMTFGRPAIITPEAAVSVPRPLPHPYPTDCVCNKELYTFDFPSSDLHFYIETLKLYEIMSETLCALYTPTREAAATVQDTYNRYFGSLGFKAAATVLEMDSKYSTWQENLPFHLRLIDSPKFQQNKRHARQTKVLSLRYAHIRTLLFRPVLSRFCIVCHENDDVEQGTLAYKLALQCSVMCVQSALDTVNLFGRVHADVRVELLDDMLPAWWYSILYLYTAATVLVAARLNPTIEREVGGEEVVLNASRTVTAALHRYGSFGKHAHRCAAGVELLFNQIPRRSHHKQQQQQEPQPHISGTMPETGFSRPINAEAPPSNGVFHGDQWTYADQRLADSSSLPFPRDTTSSLGYVSETGTAQAPPLVTETLFEPAGLGFDLDLGGDMSWLSSIPFELYGEQM